MQVTIFYKIVKSKNKNTKVIVYDSIIGVPVTVWDTEDIIELYGIDYLLRSSSNLLNYKNFNIKLRNISCK